MPFDLPRSRRDLRFTGELRAAVEEQPKGALGRARRAPRRTPRDVYQAEPIATPFVGSLPPIDLELVEDDDDDAPTTMLDRDGLDVLPGAKPRREPRPTAPVPNFRPAMPETPSVILAPDLAPAVTPKEKPKEGPPLTFWLVAAMLAACVSYKIAPVAMNQATSLAHVLELPSSSD